MINYKSINCEGVIELKKPIYKRAWFIVLILCIISIFVVNYVSNEASKIPDIDDSKNVDKITEEIGMGNVKINPNSSLDNTHFKGEKGYDIEFSSKEHTGGKAIMYKNENESVRSILWNDHVLYKEGEGILAKIGDYEVTTDEKGDLKYQSQESIKKVLKAPSSAKFPSVNEWQFMMR
jgi:hypothetical protein